MLALSAVEGVGRHGIAILIHHWHAAGHDQVACLGSLDDVGVRDAIVVEGHVIRFVAFVAARWGLVEKLHQVLKDIMKLCGSTDL